MITNLINNLNDNGIAYGLVITLSAFLGRFWAGRIARREAKSIQADITNLQAELGRTQAKFQRSLDRSLHVNKAQFEKEFAVYQQLMHDVNRVRTAFHTLHPALKTILDTEEERHKYCQPFREAFTSAFEAVRSTVEDNKPFYPVGVFQHCDAFVDLCVDEVASLSLGPGEGVTDWKEQEKMKKEFRGLVDAIVNSIRSRLESITVVE